jgi:hypothetical protein
MADSEGTFGGNGSVYWTIDVKNVKKVSTSHDSNERHSKQEGHSGTLDGATFRIHLKAPADPVAAGALGQALQALGGVIAGGSDGYVDMPIERHRHEQIVVEWESSPLDDFTPDQAV